ncbi:MAG TPA: tyrosine-type recombinase/integrase [Gemmataceae bacterium]|nr:tyrosine-type recombinase/integrase [Gemmataceae bacterium]
MAGIRKKGDAYYCTFRFQRERYNFTIGPVTETQALARGVEVDETLNLLERGRLTLPENVTLVDFVAAGGKSLSLPTQPKMMTARQLFDAYLAAIGNGSIEANSLATVRGHFKRFCETIGERFRIQQLSALDVQRHVECRHKNGVAPCTAKKEISSVRASWHWALHNNLLVGPFPGRGLRFPKEQEKEPFRTFAEIDAVADEDRKVTLWDSLYLTRTEIEEFLTWVQKNATLPWVFPLVAFAAYTGARRSEILRALATDIDLVGGTATIREKKRVKGKRSFRIVPLTARFKEILQQWLAVRPENGHLFCQAEHVTRSKTKREGTTPITKNEAHDHLKRTLAGSKWQVVRGYHVLRHSFISALASKGIDQRVIDEMVGHQSEEQRKRYRHLYPDVMRAAVAGVFG